MRNEIRARRQASERRQRLQIGGGSLLVAVIWIVALWPSGDEEPASHPVPAPRASYTPWTRLVGTTPTAAETSVPTVLQSTIPTVRPSSAGVAPPPGVQVPTSPRATTSYRTQAPVPAPTTTSTPTKKGNGSGKPPKPTPSGGDGSDLLDIFGL